MSNQDSKISALIWRARNADAAALGQLLDRYRNYLTLLARTSIDVSLRGKTDASDLVQNTLLKACQRIDQFSGRTEPEIAAWLRRILANNLIDEVRRFHSTEARQVSREQSLEDLLDRSTDAIGNLVPSLGSSPSHRAARREMGVVLADALAELNPDQREVIMLRNLEELEWNQVAASMDRSAGAVRMLWIRALKQLRPLVESRL